MRVKELSMDARYAERLETLLLDAQVETEVLEGIPERLVGFVAPFTRSILQAKQRRRAVEFIGGLMSDVERKNAESIAYRHDQERNEMQYFLGESQWDHQPLLRELAVQVGRELGRPDGVLVFDPSSFAKKGRESVGVQRQWCGRLGKIENCQVGVYMAYVSTEEHALVNARLYLPREWAKDKARRLKCHVPRKVKFKTRHELCLDMLDEFGHLLPHGWIAGDDEMGRSSSFRRELRARGECYLLAVPSNTLVRDLETALPQDDDSGVSRKAPFQRAEKWQASLPEAAWTRVDVRDGEKGPLVVEVTSCRVQAKADGKRVGPEELFVVIRSRDEAGGVKHDYYLSNAAADTPHHELTRVAKAEHRIEDCFQRGKSEVGLADYEVRSWGGWHHHQTLSLIAAWYLNCELRLGKKNGPSLHLSTTPRCDRQATPRRLPMRRTATHRLRVHASPGTKSSGPLLSIQTPQTLGSLGVRATTNLGQ
jgi:SRSO17 transposase